MCSTSKQVIDSLKYHRKLWGLSQRALAECLGWGWNTIQRLETGKNVLTLPQLVQLAEFFKTDLETFVKPEWAEKLKAWQEM